MYNNGKVIMFDDTALLGTVYAVITLSTLNAELNKTTIEVSRGPGRWGGAGCGKTR